MSSFEIFSHIELESKEVYSYLVNSANLERCSSPFFELGNTNFTGPEINEDNFFIQKFSLLEQFQLFYKVKELIKDKKIVYDFNGVLKGTQKINLIENGKSCILREKFDFSLFNNLSIPALNFLLLTFLYVNSFISHIRLKNAIYKDKKISPKSNFSKPIRSYISINASIENIIPMFNDLNKLSLWLPSFIKIENFQNEETKENYKSFLINLTLPLLPTLTSKITYTNQNQITISFANQKIKGKNYWKFFTCENETIVENSIYIEELVSYIKLLWFLVGNTFIKTELKNWNKKLKELAEKTNLLKQLELSFEGLSNQ